MLLLCVILHGASVEATPRFSDFPADTYTGPIAKARLTDVKSRQYASRLRATAKGKVNFAGNRVLTIWGCGASCVMAATVDAKTGGVAWIPFTLCCWNQDIAEPLEFRADSRLLIAHGSRNETGDGSAVNYYIFDGKKFSEFLPHGKSADN